MKTDEPTKNLYSLTWQKFVCLKLCYGWAVKPKLNRIIDFKIWPYTTLRILMLAPSYINTSLFLDFFFFSFLICYGISWEIRRRSSFEMLAWVSSFHSQPNEIQLELINSIILLSNDIPFYLKEHHRRYTMFLDLTLENDDSCQKENELYFSWFHFHFRFYTSRSHLFKHAGRVFGYRGRHKYHSSCFGIRNRHATSTSCRLRWLRTSGRFNCIRAQVSTTELIRCSAPSPTLWMNWWTTNKMWQICRYAADGDEQTVLESMRDYLLSTIQKTFEVGIDQAERLYQELLECTRNKNLVHLIIELLLFDLSFCLFVN